MTTRCLSLRKPIPTAITDRDVEIRAARRLLVALSRPLRGVEQAVEHGRRTTGTAEVI